MQSAFEGRDGRGVHIGFYRLGHERGNIEGERGGAGGDLVLYNNGGWINRGFANLTGVSAVEGGVKGLIFAKYKKDGEPTLLSSEPFPYRYTLRPAQPRFRRLSCQIQHTRADSLL